MDYAATAIKTNRIFAVVVPFVMLLFNVATFTILFVGGNQVAEGSLEIGDIMALVEYAMLILGYLLMGVAMLMFIPQAQVSARRISEVLESEALPLGDDGASKKSPLGDDGASRQAEWPLGEGGENGKFPLGKCGASEVPPTSNAHATAQPFPDSRPSANLSSNSGASAFPTKEPKTPSSKNVSFMANLGRDHGDRRRDGFGEIHGGEPPHGLSRSGPRRHPPFWKASRLVWFGRSA